MRTNFYTDFVVVFVIFDRDFAKSVAPSGDGNGHSLMNLKWQSL